MNKGSLPRWIGWTAAGLGLLLLLLGVYRGEAAVVAQKATNICLECIGIG